ETRIHATIAVELFFKRKYHQGLGHIFSQKSHTSLTPRPELRAHVIHNGNAALVHLPRHTPVESGRINDDGEVWPAAIGFKNQLVKQAPNFGKMAKDFCDSDDGKLLGIDDGVASGGAHALSANPEELELPCLRRASGVCGDSRHRLSSGARLRRVSHDSSALHLHK